MSQPPLDPLLTIHEVSEYLGVPPGTIHQWRSACRPCPAGMKIGRHLRFRRSDVEKFVAERASADAEKTTV